MLPGAEKGRGQGFRELTRSGLKVTIIMSFLSFYHQAASVQSFKSSGCIPSRAAHKHGERVPRGSQKAPEIEEFRG